MELEEAPELRFKNIGRPFVPENMVRTAELFFLGHLGRENGVDGGIVESISLPQPAASRFVSGSDEKIGVLTEVESVLEEKRDVRNEEGRAQFAGGCRRFKTFLAHPWMDDALQILPGGRVPEDDPAQGRPADRAIGGENLATETRGNRLRHVARAIHEGVDAGIRIEDDGSGVKLRENPASGGLPAGDPSAEAEDVHTES